MGQRCSLDLFETWCGKGNGYVVIILLSTKQSNHSTGGKKSK